MIVRCYRGQLNYFRKKARQHDPKEIYAVLVGSHRSPEIVDIEHIWYPKIDEATTGHVTANIADCERLDKKAKALSLNVVGAIHSHPNWVPVMSPTDHDGHIEDNASISGICSWEKGATSKVYFWRHDSSLPATLEYFNED